MLHGTFVSYPAVAYCRLRCRLHVALHVASFMLLQAELIEHTSAVPKAELSEAANATPISAEVRHWADYTQLATSTQHRTVAGVRAGRQQLASLGGAFNLLNLQDACNVADD